MTVEVGEHEQTLRMSWELCPALPRPPKAEWVVGEVVVGPPAPTGPPR